MSKFLVVFGMLFLVGCSSSARKEGYVMGCSDSIRDLLAAMGAGVDEAKLKVFCTEKAEAALKGK